MAQSQPKGYKLSEFTLLLGKDVPPNQDVSTLKFSGKYAYDMRTMCSAFNYYESVESPSIRMELVIYDTLDLAKSIVGNEYIKIRLTADASPDDELEVIQKVFKVGEVTKSERAQTYILYTVSPDATNNESNRVFAGFKDKPGEQIGKEIQTKFLKSAKPKVQRWEPARGNFNFVSPSWRAFDCISYIQDKILGGTTNRPGYLYFETHKGKNFCTMDYLCSSNNPSFSNPKKFTYTQANLVDNANNAYNIENINYPDRSNHLEKMRSGLYSNVVYGILMPALTNGNLPQNGQTKEQSNDSAAAGSIRPPVNMGVNKVFAFANTLNPINPLSRVDKEYFSEDRPTRIKIRALPGMKDSEVTANAVGSSANMDFDTVTASAYSTSRWQLLNLYQLSVTIAGNTGITAGDVIFVGIPSSTSASSQTGRLEMDNMYSGKYIVVGVKHIYKPEKLETHLSLAKDSILAP